MKEKITIIKDILKIVIFSFVIFSAIKSCSKAYTYDEFMQFVSDIKDSNIGDTSFFTYFLSKDSANKQAFTNNNLNINDYNNWLLWWNSQYNWSLYFYNGTVPDYQVLNDNLFSSITFPGSTSFKYCFSVYNNSYTYVNYSNYSRTGNTCLFLFDKDPINGDFKGAVAQNYLVKDITFTPNNQGTITEQGQVVNVIKNIYRYSTINLGKVEEYIENERFNYVELLNGNNTIASMKYNNISKQLLQSNHMDIEVVDNVSPPYDLFRVDNWVLYLDTFYTLNIYSADTDNVSNTNYDKVSTFYYIFLRENAVISNGAITSYGSGEGFTTQNATNSIIDNSQTQNSFWQNAYNQLFVISGDYIEQKLNSIKENLKFSGDYEEEIVFLNLINDNPSDFVISWQSYTPHFSLKGQQINNVQMISGDRINFSQLERENQDLHEVMEWTRAILGFSLGYLLIRNYWNTLLYTLGIGTQIYDSAKEEQESIKVEFDKKGNRTEIHSKNIGGIKYTWRR